MTVFPRPSTKDMVLYNFSAMKMIAKNTIHLQKTGA